MSKEEAFYVMAGDVQAARQALDHARKEVYTSSVYHRPWWRSHRDELKSHYYELRSDLRRNLRLGVVVMPEGFDGKL